MIIDKDPFIESIIEQALNFKEVWIDFFCGFGGVTHGIMETQKREPELAMVIACLNHDEKAIGSHKLSNPNCYHITEDIRLATTEVLRYMVTEIRRRSGNTIKIKIWFSHECTHYSLAKGGDSRDADSRSLPEEMFRYVDDLNPDEIWIENVKEFLTWGPLIQKVVNGIPVYRDNGEPWMIPDPKRKGEYYNKWVADMTGRGFSYDKRILNCADYGVPTIRKRLFIQFLKGSNSVWAAPTHSKGGTGGLEPWIPIKKCLNTDDKGESIFTYRINKQGRKIPRIKSRKTFKRIYTGCVKILEPLYEQELREYEEFLALYYSSGQVIRDVNDPSPTLTTKDRVSLVTARRFITKYYNGHTQNQSEDTPSGALTVVPKLKVISTQHFIDQQYGMSKPTSIDNPANTLTNIPKLNVVSAESAFLMNMQFNNEGNSIDQPSPTLVAKMDKKPNYLVTAEEEEKVDWYDHGFEEVRQLKEWMVKWEISDLLMRELRIPEMLKIHTMPEDLPMIGTMTEKKKFIGNQVPAKIVTKLILGAYYGNLTQKEMVA